MCISVAKHFETHGILNDAQHGFRRNCSCGSGQLILAIQDLAKGIDLGEQIDLISLDLSKAFDKAPRERLVYKAEYFGIIGSTLWWIRDFLSSKNKRIIVDGKSSHTASVKSFSGQCTWITHVPPVYK